MKEAESNRLLF
jgi:hypothetical protein